MWHRTLSAGIAATSMTLLAGCSILPNTGPMVSDFRDAVKDQKGLRFVLEPVDQHVLSILDHASRVEDIQALKEDRLNILTLGPGDALQLTIYQVGAAGAFSQGQVALGQAPTFSAASGSGQSPKALVSGLTIDEGGYITVPYAGRLHIGGQTVSAAQSLIESHLRNVLTDPQVTLTVMVNSSNLVTVLGAIKLPGRYPITSAEETFLDIIAATGGPNGSPRDTWLEITRRGQMFSIPLQKFLGSPAANIHVDKGDLINVVLKPQVYQVFGAAKMSAEFPIADNGQTVAQGLAHGGGLLDQQADPRGVYLLRYETPKVVEAFRQPLQLVASPDQPLVDPVSSRVPVVYTFDMSKPSGLFMAMHFQIQSGDLLFISDARFVEWLKVLSLLGTLTQAGSRGSSLGGGF